MKRLLDITISTIALLLFLPFGLIIALVLRFTGEGEIFYLQTRVGLFGRHFKIIKFVTMLKDSPNLGTGTVTVKDDPRVLPFGKFLRKAKLNEVPQFINVLKGDMSLVGPRPMALRDFGYYSPEIQKRLVSVKPGLTGIGSIVFRDEESIMAKSSKSNLDCYREDIISYKGRLELWYIENQSLWIDIRLLFLTAVVIVAPRNMFYKKLIKHTSIPQNINSFVPHLIETV
jgi:lipopolysaccharide/colanic/teichoic acid biosynthesis glycosyltransferase